MKIRVRPKFRHKTPLYTTIYTYLKQNNYPLLNPTRARSLVVSDLRSETKGSRFDSGC